jgi:hypothetical protein
MGTASDAERGVRLACRLIPFPPKWRVMTRFASWLLVAIVLAAGEAHATDSTVALDLSTLDGPGYQKLEGLKLEQKVVLRLVHEGFTVVAASRSPDVLIIIERHGEGLRIISHTGEGDIARDVQLTDDALEELHLEIAQKVVQIARATKVDKAQLPEPAPQPPALLPVRPPNLPAPKIVVVEDWREPFVEAGVLVRGGNVDPQFSVGARFGRENALGVTMRVGFTPSWGDQIRVEEYTILGGLTYRTTLSSQFELEFGARGGILIHHYEIDRASSANPDGVRVDGVLQLPLAVLWTRDRWRLGAGIAPGWAHRKRRHLSEGQTLWERSSGSFYAGIAGSYRW